MNWPTTFLLVAVIAAVTTLVVLGHAWFLGVVLLIAYLLWAVSA